MSRSFALELAVTLSLCACAAACGDDDTGGGRTVDVDPGDDAGDGGAPASGSGGHAGSSGRAADSGGTEGSAGAAAGSGEGGTGEQGGTSGTSAGRGGLGGAGGADAPEPDVASDAADLRVALNLLLTEHVLLSAKATGGVLGGRSDVFNAYYERLTNNGLLLGDYVGVVGGNESSIEFANLWRPHILALMNYARAVVAKNDKKKAEAKAALSDEFVPKLGTFLHDQLDIDEGMASALAADHIERALAIIDAQSTSDWPKAFTNVQTAYANMQSLANSVSAAIVAKLPDTFLGDGAAPAVDLRVNLDEALQAHTYYATWTTGSALTDSGAESSSARKALDDTGAGLAQLIATYDGSDAKDAFSGIWNPHDQAYVDYAAGIATDNATQRDSAIKTLTETFVPQLAEFLHGATDLPTEELQQLTLDYVVNTRAVIDFQGQGDADHASIADFTAALHMQKIGDTVSIAMAQKLISSDR